MGYWRPKRIVPSSGKQRSYIHALARGAKNLAWSDEQYRDWLLDTFNVNSSTLLDVEQAGRAIYLLKELVAKSRPANYADATRRIQEWNAALTTGCLHDATADPADERMRKNVLAHLWTLSKDKEKPLAYAKGILKRILGRTRIQDAQDSEKMVRAMHQRQDRQGIPTRKPARAKKQYKLNKEKVYER